MEIDPPDPLGRVRTV
jgi:hypothetical protein